MAAWVCFFLFVYCGKPMSSCWRWGLEGFWSCVSPLCHPLPRWHYASREKGRDVGGRGVAVGEGDEVMAAIVEMEAGWGWGDWCRRRLTLLNYASVSEWNLSIWQIVPRRTRLLALLPSHLLPSALSLSLSRCRYTPPHPLLFLFLPPFQLLKLTHWLGYRLLVAK